ncbi:PREDICTED: uncharacterized protein LOC105555742 [Vollenhovia emeryi]|uniref:uncharacterized protein LOC105555742 n=1 Tax=Vollenhovia emeryi TaxID=411798 RepID=UPI0005F4DAB2|nr:PREDICTED: uncharacterized protein LOC105555742 [Vollenhovia emeryi]
MLRTSRGRGHKAHKAFFVVFVCLGTKAVHLEVASDYTAAGFLAAFRRFVSRRGLCQTLYSDCGTNFVGADSQLRALFRASTSEGRQIGAALAAERVTWRFNPPSAPYFGGIWEAAVKSLKHHLRRVVGDATLTFEEMTTLLAQIEACLNSRPLWALTDDPDDITALTPGHFLVGTSLLTIPEPAPLQSGDHQLSRWPMVQRMRSHFWNRWAAEYLHSLNHRPKWWRTSSEFSPGRLCLVRNECTPPSRWPLARIVRVHPGSDGHVRVATVKTASTELRRPIVKLVLLPRAAEPGVACTPSDSPS